MGNWKLKFTIIWSGQAISFFTSAILQMALIWHLTITTNSALVLALASIAGFLPMALIGSFAGALVDRFNRKHTMIAADLYIAVISLSLVIYTLFAEPPLLVFMAVILLRSIGTAFHTPAISAVTPLIVPETHLTKCAGYTQSLQTLGFIAGTSVAAILYPRIGVSGMVILDVVGAVLASISVAVVSIPKIVKSAEAEKAEKKSGIFSEVKEGFNILRRNRGLFALLWIGLVFAIAFSPINALYPLMSMDYFGGGTTEAAIVEVIFAAGMMFGGILLGIWGGFKNRAVSMILAVALCGGGILASGLLPDTGFILFAALSFVVGASSPLYQGPQMALTQERIAPEYLGRVFGLNASLFSVAMLVGLVLVGTFAEIIGVNNAFRISGGIIILLAAIMILAPSVRNIEREKKGHDKNF
jgi:DHA3 family macrolide efflux protein-like MFS transporter